MLSAKPLPARLAIFFSAWLVAVLTGCGGGGSSTSLSTSPAVSTAPVTTTSTTVTTPVTPTVTTPATTTPTSTTPGTTTTTTSPVITVPTTTTTVTTTVPAITVTTVPATTTTAPTTTTTTVVTATTTAPVTTPTVAIPINQLPLDKRAAALAKALGMPSRLLVGLGSADFSVVQAQALKIDLYERYLSGLGADAWPNYNSPSGAYVQIVARNADSLGAVPVFTLYQMAANGDGNLAGLANTNFMRQYWDGVRLLFTQLKTYGKPALVNLEPDFWGYTQRASADPTKQLALVSQASSGDCPTLTDDVVGIAGCLVQMARKYAPNAYIGFPPSYFADLIPTQAAYMKRVGADKADFAAIPTLDRDVGCIEAVYAPANCNRATDAKLWDENNVTTPNFKQHFATARSYFETLGVPLMWWQTPLGVPSATPGGVPGAFRDNRVRYFLTHASELVAAGGFGVVFGPGDGNQTSISTDGGQFKSRSTAYLLSPAALP